MAGGHPLTFAKARRGTGVAVSPAPRHARFEPLPPLPSGELTMSVTQYLPEIQALAETAGKIVFHSFGDSGGIHGTQSQDLVAAALEEQKKNPDPASRPQFLFHLGDIVYFNGEENLYVTQFYEPYQFIDAPIFAIPGNHDGDTQVRPGDPADTDPSSLFGFMQNFCNTTGAVQFKHRAPMNQPYCYWRLEAPFVHIVGLYSNVDGSLDEPGKAQQQAWLQAQMHAVPANKWLIVAIHHPCYSLDTVHGGYGEILTTLDAAFTAAKRFPDMVLSGHVHNYQRYSRKHGAATIPYIINGNAGYANDSKLLHKLQTAVSSASMPFQTVDQAGVALEAFDESNSGFLRLTAGAKGLTADYFAVPFDGTTHVANPADSVTVQAKTNKTA